MLTETRSPDRAPDQADQRIRLLLGESAWARLPPEVRDRFSRKPDPGRSIVYAGRVTHASASLAGRLLAGLGRLIGGPLPLGCSAGMASVVAITEDGAGGQSWTRLYARPGGFPQVIRSAKRFGGPTGIEEHVGSGIGMTLQVAAEARSLVFRSVRYFFEIAGRRVYLPGWLSPGRMTVRHTPLRGGRFAFSLDLEHALFGRMLHQRAVFEELRQ